MLLSEAIPLTALGAVLLALFGYLLALTRDVGKLQQQCRQIECLPEVKRQVDRLMYRQELQDIHMADVLHSPSHQRRDELIERLVRGQLRKPELEEARALLLEAKYCGDPEKKVIAAMLLPRADEELRKLDEE